MFVRFTSRRYTSCLGFILQRTLRTAQIKVVVKLNNGVIYEAGDDLEKHKDHPTDGCKIEIIKTKLSSSI